MKKLSLLLALVMLMTCVALPSFAEESAIKESASGFYYIEAEGNRPRLSAASADKFIQADGEWFKDMNGNGELDAYEDWRLPAEDRANDLIAKMTLQQKAGSLIFSAVGGKNGSTVTDLWNGEVPAGTARDFNNEELYTSHEVVINVDGVNYSPMAFQIQDMNVTTFIAAFTGMPKDQLDVFNRLQTIAEDTPLGIPATFSGDRTYNTWGGMIDAPHYASGVAHDPELLYNLFSEYAKESVAIGYHQVFHGYGNEIGSWFGDNPNYIAEMSVAETKAYDDNGFNSHSKHFIARGGRSNYAGAKSPADLLESWMVAWKAVIDAGTQWIMMNKGTAMTPGVQVYTDQVSMDYLRNTLGYDGICCLDWPIDIESQVMTLKGITADGVDISTLTAAERYALMLNVDVDMFSALGVIPGTDVAAYNEYGFRRALPDLIVETVETGLVTEETLNRHVFRVMRNKLQNGQFENPYRDWEEALAIISNGAYTTDSAIPLNNAEIDAYRRPEIAAMEEEMMVKSTVLLKNNGILPLNADAKIYVTELTATIADADKAALAEKATVVDKIEDANVVLVHTTSFNDAYDLAVEDAQDAGKPIVLIFEGTVGRNGAQAEPYFNQVKNAEAVLMQTYNNTPDHGSSVGSFYRYTTPSVTAQMLFGEKDPAGRLVFEVPYEVKDLYVAWGELQNDIGVDPATRLYMAMLAKDNPAIDMPRNLGNVLFTSEYGMSYAKPADIQLSLLSVEQDAEAVVTENNGRTSTTINVFNKVQKAGVPFTVSFVARNNGGAGHMTVQAVEGDNVLAEKFITVAEGQWRVITLEITLDAGEHVITVGDMSVTVTAE